MGALFSSWCDEYYNLRILLIGKNLHKTSKVQNNNRGSAKPPQKSRMKRTLLQLNLEI